MSEVRGLDGEGERERERVWRQKAGRGGGGEVARVGGVGGELADHVHVFQRLLQNFDDLGSMLR